MEDKLEKQIVLIEEKSTPLGAFDKRLKILEKIEKQLKALTQKSKNNSIKAFLKKNKNSFKINLNSFRKTNDIDNIKIHIKGLKEGKDYEVFFKKLKGKIKIMIVGKGKFKETVTKTIKISR